MIFLNTFLGRTAIVKIMLVLVLFTNASCQTEPPNKDPVVARPSADWIARPAKPKQRVEQQSKKDDDSPPKPQSVVVEEREQSAPTSVSTDRSDDQGQSSDLDRSEQPVASEDKAASLIPASGLQAVIEGDKLVFVPENRDRVPLPPKRTDDSVTEEREPEPIEGLLEPAVEEADLPDIDGVFKVDDVEEADRLFAQLIGKWHQTGGTNKADIAEGGYASSEIEFLPAGTLVIRRKYGEEEAFVLTRHTDYAWNENGELVIGEEKPLEKDDLIQEEVIIGVGEKGDKVRITPAAQVLPLKMPFVLSDNKLKIGGKIYTRIKEKDTDESSAK